MNSTPHRNNRWANRLIKLGITVLLFITLYYQLIHKDNIGDLWQSFLAGLSTKKLPFLILVLVLMPFNWAVETFKWLQLIRSFSQIPYFKAFAAILSGITVSLVTPNRIGEYGGRVLLIEPEHNWKAVIATAVGNLSQFIVLCSCGTLGLIYFASRFLEWPESAATQLLLLGITLIAIVLFFYLNIGLLVPLIQKNPYFKEKEGFLDQLLVLEHYSKKLLLSTLLFSLLRYATYSLQYYLILQFFGLDIEFWTAISGIASIFLIQTSVPLPPLMGLLARGDIALFVWGYFTVNDISILAATFSLFIINLCIPALVGLAFIAEINVLKSLGYEKKTN